MDDHSVSFLGNVAVAGDAVCGDKHIYLPELPDLRPAQLPIDPPDFIGRIDAIRWLDSAVEEAQRANRPAAMLIYGMPGVGKTALAVHWGHARAARFPDGMLFVDIRGHTRQSALGQLLRSIGVPPDRVPATAAEREVQYRTMLSTRRLLIIIDNAMQHDIVRHLLPGTAGSAVAITSRSQLLDLVAHNGVRALRLGELRPEESVELLRATLTVERVNAEMSETKTLAKRCGNLPLALRIVAADLSMHPHDMISDAVHELEAKGQWMFHSRPNDRRAEVAGAFELSYQGLDVHLRRTFRYLSIIPGPTFTDSVVAVLLNISVARARALISGLERASLVEVVSRARYRIHDLLREYARERLSAEDGIAAITLAERSLVTGYLDVLRDAKDHETSEDLAREPMQRDQLQSTYFDWFESERANLVSAVKLAARIRAHRITCDLACALFDSLEHRHHSEDNIEVQRSGLIAAEKLHDKPTRFLMLLHLAEIHAKEAKYDDALSWAHFALEQGSALNDADAEGAVFRSLATIYWRMGQFELAEQYAQRALKAFQIITTKHGEAAALDMLGQIWRRQGRYAAALRTAQHALAIQREIGDVHGAAESLLNMARSARRLRRYDVGIEYANQSLTIWRTLGHQQGEAEAQDTLARIYRRSGRPLSALREGRQALQLRQALRDQRGISESLDNLARIYRSLGDMRNALDFARRALALAEEIHEVYGKASALEHLARLHLDLGNRNDAQSYASRAVEIGTQINDPHGQAHRLRSRGLVYLEKRRFNAALADFRASLKLWRDLDDQEEQAATLGYIESAYRLMQTGRDDVASSAPQDRCQ